MLKEQIDEYFSGTRKIFDLPLHTPGTDFQNLVWKKLIDIPYGEHRSYKDQALAINKPKAVRAVGKANGSNRIAIIIPCAGFGYYLIRYCQIKHGAFLGYTFAVDYVELGGFERRRDLVLYHFYAGAVANDLAAVLN